MEQLNDVELNDVQVSDVQARSIEKMSEQPLLANTSGSLPGLKEEDVETSFGAVHVATHGNRSKPAILTFHDIGLNHVSQFQGFFSYIDMEPLLKHFCVYHVNAPGQELGGNTRPATSVYPTMDEISETLLDVMNHFGLKRFIGFGVGAGANIIARFALNFPEKVDALFFINCISTQAGWMEWGYQKVSSFHLRGNRVTKFTEDYLLWHHFGKKTLEVNHDLVHVYKESMLKNINPVNLASFIETYIKRTDLGIKREMDPEKKKITPQFKCPVMVISGASSPHINETVEMNSRLDPANSTWMKLGDCGGMVLEEQPGKVCESFRLFLQGLGYVPSLSLTSLTKNRSRASSVTSAGSAASSSQDTIESLKEQPVC